ncbi:hypothetical protein ACFFUB_01490 [Algimonas porphyrae]|uniref:ATP-binding protein n=1 Tax=Algimonas porphyrae TaxID=1128113 RepID=A0ABQ5V110_9PROT|nr:hypothetical protein [Algimonas porphyrae]GLQ20710.1 hypothetical protein GCM10007854_16650 [Algimonas porphyrae]
MPIRCLTLLSLSTALLACAPETALDNATSAESAEQPITETIALTLNEAWVLDGFDAPESVIATQDGRGYYVSNVGGDGTAQDNDGVISLVGTNGTILERNWVAGTDAVPLHAPKGMTLVENDKGLTLLATDIDHVAFILADEGRLAKRLPAPDATFLNDIAKGPGASAFLSDSANARIYKLEDDTITVWLEDDRLGGVNGLQMEGDRLLVTTMSAGELLSIDLETKAITGLAAGMENADGIGLRSDGSYIISSWPGQLWHVREGEAPVLLQDTSGEEGATLMNDILLVDDATLITPNWMPGTVRGYRVQ